jgi:hypothetical protein
MAGWFRRRTRKAWRKHQRKQTKHIYKREPQQPSQGWSTTTTFKTKIKRYVRKQRRAAWRWTKRRIKRRIRTVTRERERRVKAANRQTARNRPAPPPRTTQHSTDQPPQHNGPPPDGAISTCQLGGACGNEIRYSTTRQRWEHTGKGNAECFR